MQIVDAGFGAGSSGNVNMTKSKWYIDIINSWGVMNPKIAHDIIPNKPNEIPMSSDFTTKTVDTVNRVGDTIKNVASGVTDVSKIALFALPVVLVLLVIAFLKR